MHKNQIGMFLSVGILKLKLETISLFSKYNAVETIIGKFEFIFKALIFIKFIHQ